MSEAIQNEVDAVNALIAVTRNIISDPSHVGVTPFISSTALLKILAEVVGSTKGLTGMTQEEQNEFLSNPETEFNLDFIAFISQMIVSKIVEKSIEIGKRNGVAQTGPCDSREQNVIRKSDMKMALNSMGIELEL